MFVNRSFAGNIRFALSQKIRRIPCGFFDTTVIYNTSGTFPHKRSAKPHHPPHRTSLPEKELPASPRRPSKRVKFPLCTGGDLREVLGGRGRFGGGRETSFKRSPSPSKVFFPLQGLSLFLRKRHSQTVATLVVGMPRVTLYPNVGHPMPRNQRKKPLP